MARKRSTVTATDLRVKLGEMLRRLQEEDLVIERGGIPVAILSPWQWGEGSSRRAQDDLLRGDDDEGMPEVREMDERALLSRIEEIKARYAGDRRAARKPDAAAWERTKAAVRKGWDIDGEKLIDDIYRWRREGSRLNRYYVMSEDGAIREVGDEDIEQLPDRQRRLHGRDQPAGLVADRGPQTYGE